MAGASAQYQQKMQNIEGERGQRLQAHMAARDAYKAANDGKIDSLTAPMGPSGDPLFRSSVSTTDLKPKERAAGQEYAAASREKTGGGHWQYDKKTVDSAMGPITQTTARRIATPTKGEVIRQGLAGGGSLYDRRSTLHDPNAPKPPPGATGLNPTGEKPPPGATGINPTGAAQPTGPSLFQSATTDTTPAPAPQAAPAAPAAKPTAPAAPQPPVKEDGDDDLQKLKEFLSKRY
jgi:hypothetical protein